MFPGQRLIDQVVHRNRHLLIGQRPQSQKLLGQFFEHQGSIKSKVQSPKSKVPDLLPALFPALMSAWPCHTKMPPCSTASTGATTCCSWNEPGNPTGVSGALVAESFTRKQVSPLMLVPAGTR